jgi:hypothetical protein
VITCLRFVHIKGWITFNMLVHTITFKIISTHGLIIGVVTAINEIDQCTTVRSSDQIQQKLTEAGEGRYVFQ